MGNYINQTNAKSAFGTLQMAEKLSNFVNSVLLEVTLHD